MQSENNHETTDLEEGAKIMLLNGESHALVKWFIRQNGGSTKDFSHLFEKYPEVFESGDPAPEE